MLGLKDDPNTYFLVPISDQNDEKWNFSDSLNLGVQVYPKTGQP